MNDRHSALIKISYILFHLKRSATNQQAKHEGAAKERTGSSEQKGWLISKWWIL